MRFFYGSEDICAVRALKHCLDISGILSGPIFCVTHNNTIVLHKALKPASVSLIVKEIARVCDLKNAESYSAHSLRRGFATMAARKGAILPVIMRQGRWKRVL